MAHSSPPPLLVLSLVADYLDPKTLTVASCVSKSWSLCLSSDHLWHSICSALFSSLSNLHATNPAVSYRRLFMLGCMAQRRRLQKPVKPELSLDSIIFAINIYNGSSCLSTTTKSGDQLRADSDFLFQFNFDYDVVDSPVFVDVFDDLRITWNVVLKGFRSVFTMMDCKGKGSIVLGLEGWFSKELPPAGCCSGVGSSSGLAADLRLGLKDSGGGGRTRRVAVDKLSVGIINIVSWRYAAIDDILRYLQHFLT